MYHLEEKVVVVTGGTRGIGLATVRAFLQEGATVILCGSRQETAHKALAALKEEHADWPVTAIWPDLTDLHTLQQAFADIRKSYGHLDVLVNNAGISARESLYEYQEDDFKKILDLNLLSVFNGCKAAAEIMKPQGGGVILNTSSMVSLYGQSAGVGYPATKSAVNGLTKSLARELGKDHIRVNAVAPGPIETDMVRALPEQYLQPLLAKIALGRFGQPEEIAAAFLFLASEQASFITGAVLSVDGAAIN